MNIDNLNKLIAHLEKQPPDRVNMGVVRVQNHSGCGTAGCIQGHCYLIFKGDGVRTALGLDDPYVPQLMMPDGYAYEQYNGASRYPAHRVIATLKRLRDTFLSTGQVVVDWGPEPGEEPKQVWTAPQVAEVINPALPAELTSLLRNTVEA